jgi:FkbM family methyltransferase
MISSVSQYGEDVIVWQYFGEKTDGIFIEVGANDPVNLSQTWFLEQKGWRGVLVEPMPECCERLRQKRPGSQVCQAAAGAAWQPREVTFDVPASDAWAHMQGLHKRDDIIRQIKVPLRTLDEICDSHGINTFDFLSVDVEGMELQVLEGLDLARRKPRLVLLEDHLDTLDLFFYMRRHGYRLVKRTGCNNWWVAPGAPGLPETTGERLHRWKEILIKRAGRKLVALFRPKRKP